MPQMGYDMREGTLVRWLKAEGTEIDVGDPVAEIETDKAVVEFESVAAGVLRKRLVSEGATVPVGHPLAIVGDLDEEIPDMENIPSPQQNESTIAEETGSTIDLDATEPVSEPALHITDTETPTQKTSVRASPVAKKLALEENIDLALVPGTGPGNRITRGDVIAYKESRPSTPPTPALSETPSSPDALSTTQTPSTASKQGEKVPLTKMRQQIARVTVQSKREAPHFYVSAEIDMTAAMSLRSQINKDFEGEGIRVTVNDLILKACIGALKKYPKFNAYFDDDGIRMNEEINIGIAIAEEEGLILPAVMNSGTMSLKELSRASKDLADRAQSGTLRPQEYTGGTFSTSNLGMFNVSSFAAIIHPPQSAVLAVGTVSKKPVVDNDEFKIAEMLTATISVDHRVADGSEGAQFLVEVKRLLEHPSFLLI